MAIVKPWKSLVVTLVIYIIITYLLTLILYFNFADEVQGVIKYINNIKDICVTFYQCFMFVIDNTYKSNGGFTGSSFYYVSYPDYNFRS